MNDHEGVFCKTTVSGILAKFVSREKNATWAESCWPNRKRGFGGRLTSALRPNPAGAVELGRGELALAVEAHGEDETGERWRGRRPPHDARRAGGVVLRRGQHGMKRRPGIIAGGGTGAGDARSGESGRRRKLGGSEELRAAALCMTREREEAIREGGIEMEEGRSWRPGTRPGRRREVRVAGDAVGSGGRRALREHRAAASLPIQIRSRRCSGSE